MQRRILIYAAVYGVIGVVCGVLMAVATKDNETPVSFLLHGNNGKSPESNAKTVEESTPVVERVEES